MSPDELPSLLGKYRDLAATAAPDAVMAMAEVYQDYVKNVELRRSSHPMGIFGTTAAPGQPPAWVTGRLARSVWTTPGYTSGTNASASVAPHTIYAGVQEYGGDIFAKRRKFMHWRNERGAWFKKRVHLPSRPYMRPAAEAVIANGSLSRAAMRSFQNTMKGLAG